MNDPARTVLVVAPDAPSLAGDLTATIRDEISVVEATTGTSALSKAVEMRPAAIVLDLATPDLAPDEILEILQADPVLRLIPVVCIAATYDDDAIGALRRHEYITRPFSPDELAARVSAALAIKELRDRLSKDAHRLDIASRTDALTGLWNRHHVNEQLPILAAAARRQQVPLAMVLVEVDHLGSINQSYGQEAGDDVLRQVAGRLRETARIEDVCGRWSGETFVSLLPATDLDGAWRLGERVRAAVSERPFPVRSGAEVVVTVSAGCTSCAGCEPSPLLTAAESALREARTEGRNLTKACTPTG